MQEALQTMLQMQDRMNTRVHPQWIEQDFAWHRAIWVECAELVDHYGYKWWKKQEHDMAQVQLEVVDIWHFGLSALFTSTNNVAAIAAYIQQQWPQEPLQGDVLIASDALAGIAAREGRFDVAAFAGLLGAAQMSFDELYRQYLGKNVLNFFRQDNGYKDGSYRKLWAGREDNEHLMELLANIDTGLADAEKQLYAALALRYGETA